MTQATTQIASGKTGTEYRTADNAGKLALQEHHKGSVAPTYATAGIIWLDDNATPWKLKVYDGTDWITLGEVNATNNTFQPYNGTATPRMLNHAADTGSANAYAVAPAPAITAYALGQIVTLKPVNANTTASTINVNGLGTKNIKLLNGADPAANALLTTGVYALMYDGTSFIALNPSDPVFVGDSGSGGTAGLVPAPASGDAAAGKVLTAGGTWVASGASFPFRTTSAATTIIASDKGGVVQLTGSTDRTWDATAVATLGANFSCELWNDSTAIITFDPNSSEQVDALTSIKMYPGEHRRLTVNAAATAFTTGIIKSGVATFTASGTWTRPPGYTSFIAEIMSGGGAGACRTTTGNAGGGGGGVFGQFLIPAVSFVAVGSTETITVGGTAAGVTGNTNGTAGNASSITINGTTLQVAGPIAAISAASGNAAAGGGASTPAVTFNSNTISGVQGGQILAWAIGGDVTAGNAPELNTLGQAHTTYGGGSGGASSSTAGGVRTAGATMLGGAGGVGGATAGGAPGNGTAPGGGGGGSNNNTTSGSGAAGQIVIRGIV